MAYQFADLHRQIEKNRKKKKLQYSGNFGRERDTQRQRQRKTDRQTMRERERERERGREGGLLHDVLKFNVSTYLKGGDS